MTRYRRRLGTLLAALFVAQFLVVSPPALACACGGVLTQGAGEPKVADETALVRYQGQLDQPGTEDIVMSLRLTGSPTSAAWFLPVPARPAFGLGDVNLFSELATLTAPVVEHSNRANCGRGACAVAPQSSPSPDVSVLQQVSVGPYEATTLAATDGNALRDWLAQHGFQLPDAIAQGIQPYAQKKWVYVAVRLSPASGRQTLGEQLPPLRVSFPSPELVYPMRLTALASRPQTVRLYVVAEHRVTATGSGPPESAVTYADWVQPGTGVHTALDPYLNYDTFLTRFDQKDLQPSSVTDDYHFVRAGNDTTYRRTITGGSETGSSSLGPRAQSYLSMFNVLLTVHVTMFLLAVLGVVIFVLIRRLARRPGRRR